jgi:large subunit ribosomal protein L19
MAATKVKHRRTTKSIQLPRKGLLDLVKKVEEKAISEAQRAGEIASFAPGDTIKVHVKIKEGDKERIQVFEGVVIKIGNKGGSRSFVVRKISHGVGVERIFLFNSPKIAKVELVQTGKVRRAKLYYLRRLEGRAAKIDRDMAAENKTTAEASAKTK